MISTEKQKIIDTMISDTWPDENGPGVAVAVLKNGDVIYTNTRGVTNIDDPSPISIETNFRIASVTKQFTAMSILILQKKGLLSIEDPMTKYLPEYSPWGDGATVENLLHHTSGLLDYENLMPEDTVVPIHDDGVVALLAQHPELKFPAGSDYSYSNSGYASLSVIVERVSGMSFPEFLKTEIFNPLGMDNTVAFRKGINSVPHRAYGHRYDEDGIFEFADQSMTSSVHGDGGIYTSLNDYAKWNRAIRTGHKILPSDDVMQKAWTSGKRTDGSLINYGYGWNIEDADHGKVVWHTGGTRGFNHCVRHHMADEYTIVLFSNLNGSEPKKICGKISELIAE